MRAILIVVNAFTLVALAGCVPSARYELDQAQASGDPSVELVVLRDTESGVEAAIAPARGGELSSLRVRSGDDWTELLYLGRDYTPRDDWTGKAPLLWPATGRNFPPDLEERRKAGEVFHDGAWEWNGQRYPMPIHGFARDQSWEVQGSGATPDFAQTQLALEDTPTTREMYPFGFRITVDYVLADGALEIEYEVSADPENEEPMPFSIGNHITFVTPLVSGGDPGKVVLVTPSAEEILKTNYGVPTGETRPRSHADGIELADFERRGAVSLTGYSGETYIELSDPAGLTVRMSHAPSEVPAQPVILYNLWGDAPGGFFSPEPWVGLQNSLVAQKGLIHLQPGSKFDWTIRIEISRGSA
jgi:galactose mutarotase-like enzyme